MFIYDLPFEEYRAINAFNNSMAGLIERSPLHAVHGFPDSSDSLDFGSLVHTLVLEPETFDSIYAVTDLNLATKEGKAFKAEAESSGKKIVKGATVSSAYRARDSIMTNDDASYLLRDGNAEVTMLADIDGTPVKARVDWLRTDGVLVDLKTTQDASVKGFAKSIHTYNYHRQGAFYSDIYNLQPSCWSTDFIFVAVENKPPFAVKCHSVSPQYFELGREKYLRALDVYRECKQRDVWPGYPNGVHIHEPPAWMGG